MSNSDCELRASAFEIRFGFCTGLPESIPYELNPSSSACFCPKSMLSRCVMGSSEDRLANLVTRSHPGAASEPAA